MSYSISRAPNELSVVVPRRFSLFVCLFFPLWLGVWVTLAIMNPAGKSESFVVPVGFGFMSIVFMYHWLWNLGGREELEFTAPTLTSRRVLFGISRTRVFDMYKIVDPHFVQSSRRGPMSGTSPSGLGFSYNGKLVRLADHLTQAEATTPVAEVIRHFPEHAASWASYEAGMPDSDKDVTLDLKF